MDYITAQQAATKWGISDRRVRVLCAEGAIAGAVKQGKSYQIPRDAIKPTDRRRRKGNVLPQKDVTGYLKWDNDTIGIIDKANNVEFLETDYNKVVALYTRGNHRWTSDQFTEFLAERMVNRERRDIERILFRCGLSHYDVLRIAEVTRGIHPKDLLWIARSEDETLASVITKVFESVFNQSIDLVGDSIDTPEGYNIKRYGVFEGRYGIFKQRISPLVTDVESEIAVYLLAEKLGVPSCPTFRVDKDTVFSAFLYDFSKEYIVHFRRLFDGPRSDNEYRNLLMVRPQYADSITRMILLDFITRQDDRRLSNIAIKISGGGGEGSAEVEVDEATSGGAGVDASGGTGADSDESFYALYDNGRSLFYEDTEETVQRAVEDVAAYATSFGYSGTYWDYVQEIAAKRNDIDTLVNLKITDDEIHALLEQAGFSGYRLIGAAQWIAKTIGMVRSLISST